MKEFPSFFTHDTPLPAVGEGVPAKPQQPDREGKQAYEPLPEYIPEQRALDTYRDMFTPHDIPLVKEVLRSMGDDPRLWRSRSQCEPITHTWPHLSFNAQLFLLHTAIGIMTSPSAHDGKDDPELRAEEIINYCEKQESNFFLKNFAHSFQTESNRADASIERKRDILAGLWESSVRYGDEDDPVRVSREVQKEAEKKAREVTKGEYPWNDETYKAEIRKGLPPTLPAGGKVTIFETSPVTYQWFDRYVEGPGDLTDEECAKLYDQLVYEDHFFRDFNPHHLDTSEWLNSERDTTFEKQHIPTSVYNRFIDERIWDNQEDFDANFAVCKVSSDVYALYGSDGGVHEYFKSPQEREADSALDVSQLLQDIHALMHDLGFDAPRMSREGTTYTQFVEANKALLEVIPHSLSERLKRYCEYYNEQKHETHEYASPHHEFLYEEYKVLMGELLAWCKETLGTHTIAATPFRELIHLSQGDTHALEHEFKHTLFASKRMREHMERYFGFAYEDISLETQLDFLEFVVNKDEATLERVRSFLNTAPTKEGRIDRFTAFCAQRFDPQIGFRFFEMASALPQEERDRAFTSYARIIEASAALRNDLSQNRHQNNLFHNLSHELTSALRERGTDMFYALDAVRGSGPVTITAFKKYDLSLTSTHDVITSMETYAEALSTLASLLRNEQIATLTAHESGELESFSFSFTDTHTGTPRYCTIQLREEGTKAFDPTRSYDGEARINFLFGDKPIPFDTSDPLRREALSIRLDREGLVLDNDRNVITNDPTIEKGMLSLDIGSFEDTVGRVVSIGNALATQEGLKRNEHPEYYHNRGAFSHVYGERDMFAHMVHEFRRALAERYAITSSRPQASQEEIAA